MVLFNCERNNKLPRPSRKREVYRFIATHIYAVFREITLRRGKGCCAEKSTGIFGKIASLFRKSTFCVMKVRRGRAGAKRGNFFERRVGEPDPSKSGSQPESRTIMYCFVVCVDVKIRRKFRIGDFESSFVVQFDDVEDFSSATLFPASVFLDYFRIAFNFYSNVSE